MKTRALCLGDSLTAGNLGVSWLGILAAGPLPDGFELINAGEDGYTMAGLERRLGADLERGETPDILILEGGANDILLPHMQSAGRAWDPFIRKLHRHGSRPAASSSEFEQSLKRITKMAGEAEIRRIIVCTIPCLGEDMRSSLNRRREEYNRIIRAAAPILADPARSFEDYLSGHQPASSYLFRAPEDLQLDALTLLGKGEEELCRGRGLKLTIDGAHLNSRGARLFAKVIEKSLFQ